MNVKIQGGGNGKYANTGSSFVAMEYLNHENDEQKAEKGRIEPFFDQKGVSEGFAALIEKIDQNKGKLGSKEAKFYAVTISPSKEELAAMGKTEEERSKAMKAYTRQVMDEYAQNFGKGLRGEDLVYFAKIHHNRGEAEGMHAHVIVSRMTNNPDRNKKARLSPQTTYTKRVGKVNGFNRENFVRKVEDRFDDSFNYERDYEQSFEYLNAMKNGTAEQKIAAVEQSKRTPKKTLLQEKAQEAEQQLQDQKNLDKILAREQDLEKEKNKPKSEKEWLRDELAKSKDCLDIDLNQKQNGERGMKM